MKPISRTSLRLPLLLVPLLLSVSSPAQNTRKGALLVPAKPRESSVLDVSVDLTTKTGSTLKAVIEDVVEQIPEAPSVIFKPGSEDAPVPIMRVEGVRLQDLLDALQNLMRVHIEILNPGAKNGRPLIVVEARDQAPRASRPVVPSRTSPPAQPVLPGVAPAPTPPPGPLSSPAPAPAPSRTTGGAFPNPGSSAFAPARPGRTGGGAVTWSPGPNSASFTRTFALAALLEEEESHSAIIDAINTVWSTAVGGPLPVGDDGPRIAFHQPSGLLIIRANQSLQEQAEEVIANMTAAHEARHRASRSANAMQDLEKRSNREIEHLKQLHETMIRQIESKYTAEIDQLRVELKQLEANNSLLKARLEAGGSR